MTSNSTKICSFESKTIKMTAYLILMMVSLAGNSLIIAVFYRNKSSRMTVHYFIANTAVSDLIIPTILLPSTISKLYNNGQWFVDGVLGNILCKLVSTASYVSVFISMLNMAIIAVDRFYAIVFPMKTALVSKKNCFCLIIMSWILAVVSQFYLLYTSSIEEHQNTIRCIKPYDGVTYKLVLSMFILTAVILTGLYSTIVIFLYRQQSRLHLASEATKLRSKENRKVTTMLIFLVVPFYLLWIPFLILKCEVSDNCLLSWITCILPLWYTVVSPVVLFVFSKNFRQGCREILYSFSLLCNVKCSNASVPPQQQ